MQKLMVFVVVLYMWPVLAVTQSLPAEDPALDEKVRGRKYLGGRDEENLKVQEELPVPRRKVDRSAIHKQVYESLEEKKEESKTAETN